MKYNYVVLGSNDDFYKASYADLNNCDNARYISSDIDSDNFIINYLYRLHYSYKLNKIINIPFKSIWNKKVFKNTFDSNKRICFILFASRKKLIDNGLIDYLREKYPDCKIAFFYQDMVSKSVMSNIDDIKKWADIILSFDQRDAKEYNVIYYPLVYSHSNVPINPTIEESDIYFVGKAKDRLDKILDTYKILKDAGFKCDFHLIGVEKEKQLYSDEIYYQNQMPYLENLQRINACKCMLEIMQIGGHGFTLRYCEAIMYDKSILTDNPTVNQAAFYNEKFIYQFKSPFDIDSKRIQDNMLEKCDYNFKRNLSPIELLKFIDNKLME